MTGKKFESKNVPTGAEICEKQLFNLVDRMEKVEVDHEQIGKFLPVIYKKLEWLSREELIKHFVSVEFNRFLSYYKNTPDLNVVKQDKSRKTSSKTKFITFQINAGKKKGLNPTKLIGLINDLTGKRNIPIGRIDIGSRSSTFEIDPHFKIDILQSFSDTSYKGNRLKIETSIPERRNVKNKSKKYYE